VSLQARLQHLFAALYKVQANVHFRTTMDNYWNTYWDTYWNNSDIETLWVHVCPHLQNNTYLIAWSWGLVKYPGLLDLSRSFLLSSTAWRWLALVINNSDASFLCYAPG